MSWQDAILKKFIPRVSHLTIAADPDYLLRDEIIAENLRRMGFEIIPFEETIAFRYVYERMYRPRLDNDEWIDVILLFPLSKEKLSLLPDDFISGSLVLSFGLGDIFPKLNSQIVSSIGHAYLDALFNAQELYNAAASGENGTKEFILRHVFGIAPELIVTPVDMLRVLLRRHYEGQRIPQVLDDHIIHVLRLNGLFDGWPLETILPDREAFFAFLQEGWSRFLDSQVENPDLMTAENAEAVTAAGRLPRAFPFQHHDIRVYMDNLFTEGFLKPVYHDSAYRFKGQWISIGVQSDTVTDRLNHVRKLLNTLAGYVPSSASRYDDWFKFGRKWAELSLLVTEYVDSMPKPLVQEIAVVRTAMDTAFTDWLNTRYAGLINLPPTPPVMVHHLPRYLARKIEKTPLKKIALLVVDGLSLDQWLIIKQALKQASTPFQYREYELFAWIPTLTSISRQALFAGKPPLYFPGSIWTTEKEAALWSQFWTDQGVESDEIGYRKGLGDGSLEGLKEELADTRIRVLGLVVNKVDDIMHGMELGAAGMCNQVRQWAASTYLSSLLELLAGNGFDMYLTADHGNIDAEGIGKCMEGSVADIRGERARVYSNRLIRDNIKRDFPDSSSWDGIGLPDDTYTLIAPHRKAFAQKGKRTVCHGGYCLEEVIVPLIRIEKGAQ